MKRKTAEAQAELLPVGNDPPKAKEAPAPAKTKAVAKVVKRAKTGRAVAIAQPRPQESQSIMGIIAAAARDPSFNPDNMRALLDMRKAEKDEDARMAFTTDFIAMQADLPTIRQDGKIEIREKDQQGGRTGRVQQATPYATFNAIMKAVKKPLQKHGFALSFSTEPAADGRILVRGILDHKLGHQRTTVFPLPAETSGSKNNLQGWGSTMSYGKRYATIALLNLTSEAPEDRDTDGNVDKTMQPTKAGGFVETEQKALIARPQFDVLTSRIAAVGLPVERFLTHYGIEKVADLPADLFDAAMKQLADYETNKKAKQANG